MDIEKIDQILNLIEKRQWLDKLAIREGDFYLKASRAVQACPPLTTATQVPAQASSAPAEVKGVIIRSILVGTFYAGAAPDASPFVTIGDIVKKGQVICIVEAMKLMNEVEAEVGGKIIAIYVENARPVEYGEPLFLIDDTVQCQKGNGHRKAQQPVL